MNTYAVVHVDPDRWAIEWSANGRIQGLTHGVYCDRADACFIAYELARREMQDAPEQSRD